MHFEPGKYYHLFNRTNNYEIMCPEERNYDFFYRKAAQHLSPYCTIEAYVIMPTHFHFLIRCDTPFSNKISQAVGVILRSYTRAINKRYRHHGSLFQQNSKAKEVKNERHFRTLIEYIRQNPVRAGLVSTPEEWRWSSAGRSAQ